MQVRVTERERMSLLGLMLADVLASITPSRAQRFGAGARGDVVIRAGDMKVTLRFDDDGVTIERGAASEARARIEGSLGALLDVALGEALLMPLLAGRLHVRGDPLLLLRLAVLLRGAR